jgi:type II secretory pathway pseudopilin PulG
MVSTTKTSEPWRRARGRRSERGFTLAALIVILTVIAVFAAFTIPRMWSGVLQRDREQQTIFVMKQYARAIYDYQKKHGLPTSLDQLKDARLPRYIRGPKGELVDPLTGKMDWVLVPPGTTSGGPTTISPTTSSGTSTAPTMAGPGLSQSGDQKAVGPFIGIRPPLSGKSLIEFNGQDSYDKWLYTMTDVQNEIALLGAVPGGPPPVLAPR